MLPTERQSAFADYVCERYQPKLQVWEKGCPGMNIYSQENTIAVCASAVALVAMGNQMLKSNDTVFLGRSDRSELYPDVLEAITITVSTPLDSLLHVKSEGRRLHITGDSKALGRLGQSLVNVFHEASSGRHLHLDYYEGNGLLAPTELHLIFECTSEK